LVVGAKVEDYNQFLYPRYCQKKVKRTNKEDKFTRLLSKLSDDGPPPEKVITIENCGGKSFSTVPGSEYWIDYQEIKV